jgi:ZIP family zinc transporter
VLEAAWWGFVGGAALLVGAAIGVLWQVPARIVGLVMGFGAGVLFSALAFELAAEAYETAGAPPVVAGLLAGALVFYAGDAWLDRRGADRRKCPAGGQPGTAASALVLGALLDGIPESAAIGLSLVDGAGVGVAVVTAVFLSNVPEAVAASVGLRAAGQGARHILGVWGLVTLAGTVAAALGYALMDDVGSPGIAATQACAAGAILTMLADTMLPEAVEHAGPLVGLVTALGFVAAFLLSTA